MKTTSVAVLGLVMLGLLAAANAPGTDPRVSSLVGTWQLVSEKWNDAKEFTDASSERKAYKHITPTHFVWVWVDPKTKKILNSMGGTYRHEGESYVEHIEFTFEGMEAYLGKDQRFTAKVEGDQWTHSGKLSQGQTLVEIWKRAK